MKLRRTHASAIALLVTAAMFTDTVARAYPSDVFATPGAVPTPQQGKETNPSFTSDRVDGSGAATVRVPIPTAPSRNGQVPSLALTYSSKNPVRGGLAMGWSLDIPLIEVDTSRGIMQEIRYRASDGGRLIRVDEPVEPGWTAYRGEEDGSFTRFERGDQGLWRARKVDGTVLYFGESDASRDAGNAVSAGGQVEGRWFLTRSVDKYGNEIQYNYEKVMGYAPEGENVPVDIALASVAYGANATAGLTHHTTIHFDYAPMDERWSEHCDVGTVPIGALMDYRTGMMIYKGAARLTRVRLETRGASGTSERRRLDLHYDEQELRCRAGAAHAPLRVLTGVTETAFAANGTATVLPTQTFEYNRLERVFDAERSVSGGVGTGGRRGEDPQGNVKLRDWTDRMMLDLDGDGRLDRLRTGPTAANGSCTAEWERGLAQGFAPAQQVGDDATFLTLSWGSLNPASGCSLSHQLTSLDNTPGTVCGPPPQGAPPNPSPDTQMKYQIRDWNHDGLPDLLMTAESRGDAYRAELDPSLGPDPVCNDPPDAGAPPCVRREEKACGGYVTRVRYNQGDGTFSAPEALVLPAPLDPEQGVNGTQRTSYVDFDGDGWEDQISLVQDAAHTYNVYQVRFNLRDGTFSGPAIVSLPLIEGYDWNQGAEDELHGTLSLAPSVGRNRSGLQLFTVSISHGSGDGPLEDAREVDTGSVSYTTGELRDLNGDGLVDYVFSRGHGARVLFNRGKDFNPYLGTPPDWRGHLFLDATQPSYLERSVRVNALRPTFLEGGVNGAPVLDGPWFSRSTLRAVDFDGDGLVDLVKLPEPRSPDSGDPSTWYTFEPDIGDAEQAELFLNLGDHFVSVGSSAPLERAKHALAHRMENGVGSLSDRWYIASDFVDLDGDGLPEAVDGRARYDANDQPMRLLKAFHDGRGGHVSYHYRPVVGEGTPHVVWVVDQTSSRADVGAEAPDPELITSYDHAGPIYGPDPDGEYAFRGFTQVTTTLPSGAYRVETNDYTQSYRGLAVREEVFAADGALASSTSRTYETRSLFDADAHPGKVTTFHPVMEQTRTCQAGQTYTACLASGERRVVERGFVAPPPVNGGAPARHVMQWERLGPVPGAVSGNKTAWYVPAYTSTASTYLDHPSGVANLVYDAQNVARQASATWHYYDTSKRCAFWTSRTIDDNATFATSTHICDLATGNVVFEMSPRFFGTSGPGRVNEFDADRRFVTKVTNELGHSVFRTWDAATGFQASERGPNAKGASGVVVHEGWEADADGLGRELRRRVFLDDVSLGYRAEEISRATYFDPPGQPSRVVSEKRIDIGGSRWAKTEALTDALGRSIIDRVYENGAVRAETRKFYDSAGRVSRVKVPRPGAFDLAFVEWQYGYDSLGRMVEVREPSRLGCTGALGTSGACGKRWAYSGRTTTERDAIGLAGGKIAETRSTIDAFGRLAKVEERLDDGSWATTTYAFDGNDNVKRVTNADGVVTTMDHDQLGRRIGVTRGASTWRFGYDAASNLTSVTAPFPAGQTESDYVTTLTYDALGRETTRAPAKRGWKKAELDAFGTGTVTTTYDAGTNGVGRVSSVEVDWGNPDRYRVDFAYEARGLVSGETHAFSLLEGVYADTRTLARTFTAQGLPASATEADGDLSSAGTELVTTYDTRGLPGVTYWTGHGWTQQVRRLADGRVFHRYWSRAGVLQAEGNTAFDDAGRVTWLNVKSKLPGDASATPRVAQGYHFDGAGDVTHFDTVFSPDHAPAQSATAVYTYDAMHRLVGATGDRGYQGAFAYSPGGRISAANVSADASAVRVHGRNVTYRYPDQVGNSSADPDAPIQIVHAATGGDFMDVVYDLAGNAIARTIDGETYEHLYDGLDRQRQVTAPDGAREIDYYGADGMRALVVTVDANGAVERVQWNLGGTEIWYDGGGNVEKTVATAALDGAMVRVVDRDHHELVFQDPRLHAIATIGDDGAMLAGFSYGPYGELLRAFGSETEDHLRRFNGKQWDATSGLAYYGYRYYDEASLTWTQSDPKYRWSADAADVRPRHASLYAFSNGNPVGMVDPNGLQPKVIENRGKTAPPEQYEDIWAVPLVDAMEAPFDYYPTEAADALAAAEPYLLSKAADQRMVAKTLQSGASMIQWATNLTAASDALSQLAASVDGAAARTEEFVRTSAAVRSGAPGGTNAYRADIAGALAFGVKSVAEKMGGPILIAPGKQCVSGCYAPKNKPLVWGMSQSNRALAPSSLPLASLTGGPAKLPYATAPTLAGPSVMRAFQDAVVSAMILAAP